MSSSDARIRIGLVGIGQIAKVQHIPVLLASPEFQLTALASRSPPEAPDGVATFRTLGEMIAAGNLDAVALCMPPQVRYDAARTALEAGLHVLLEKPPAQTVSEVDDLAARAAVAGRTLFASWHSMFSGAVAPARAILAERGVTGMRITWKEDVEKFHPGVSWFWEPGGMGVFDPGINAFSIAVGCLPEALFVRSALFRVPEGAHTPVAASIAFATPTHQDGFSAELDWDHRGDETWSITWTLGDGGVLELQRGGADLALDGKAVVQEAEEEYPRLYRHFAALIREGRSDAETRPLQIAADAFSLARIERVAAFR